MFRQASSRLCKFCIFFRLWLTRCHNSVGAIWLHVVHKWWAVRLCS